MSVFELLAQFPILFTSLVFILGLLVGSFLNVVIYRLPIMMHRSWRQECREFLEMEAEAEAEPFNLSFPHSHCPQCKNPVKPWQNIPVLSYLLLGGRCAHCGNPISIRYPLIEALTGLLSAVVAWHFGFAIATLWALLLTWVLITLSFIDIDHQLLPDHITLPILWLGIFINLFSLFTDLQSSVIGAIAGYLSLWLVYQGFKLLTGKEGMGYGDFKLLALLGAWLGWQYLPMIILLSSLVGTVIGVAMIILVKHDRRQPIPFGPYLAAAGWLALIWGDQLNQLYLNAVGL